VKKVLPKVIRKPKYYFIADFSNVDNRKGSPHQYIQRIEDFIKENGLAKEDVKVIKADYTYRELDFVDGDVKIDDFSVRGGFYLERVIKGILKDNYLSGREERPVIIAVTDDIEKAVMNSFSDMNFALPEDDMYYVLNEFNRMNGIPFVDDKVFDSVGFAKPVEVLKWTDDKGAVTYLRDDHNDSIIYKTSTEANAGDINNVGGWKDALLMQSMNTESILNTKGSAKVHKQLIKGSLKTGIMIPVSSYIVLETEAQEKVLKEAQNRILNSPDYMGLPENLMTNMSEPSLWLLLIPLLFLFWKKRKVLLRLYSR
jgi:hypothetical protein